MAIRCCKVGHTLVCSFLYVKIEIGGDYMKKITIEQFDEVYALFEEAFIPEELRTKEKMKSFFEEGRFDIYVMEEKGKVLGALIIWEFEDFVYLENFAVDQKQRNHGIGSRLLQEMKSIFPTKTLILEVDEPSDNLSKRRIAFYQRNGYHLTSYDYIQPPLRKDGIPVHLYLMSYPYLISKKEFEAIKDNIFQTVYQYKGDL